MSTLVDGIDDEHLPHGVTLQPGLWLPVTVFTLNNGPVSKIVVPNRHFHTKTQENRVQVEKQDLLECKVGWFLVKGVQAMPSVMSTLTDDEVAFK